MDTVILVVTAALAAIAGVVGGWQFGVDLAVKAAKLQQHAQGVSPRGRMLLWAVAATVANVLVLVCVPLLPGLPPALQTTLYKISLVTLFAWIGYWFDRALAPYARPDAFLPAITTADALMAGSAQTRRALIIAAFILGGALGL